MRKYVLPLALIASLGASTMAMAATNHHTTGTIKALDAKLCVVTLDNKTAYHFAKKCDFSTVKVGEKVVVTWHRYKTVDVGTAIAAAPAPKTTAKMG